jgi:endogenous inhibitor of DNA gyrase (YacG/DUF329 family)
MARPGRKGILVNCENCGGEFEKEASEIASTSHNFCSLRCHGEAGKNQVTVTCMHCGDEFTRKRSSIGKTKSGKFFCSSSCSAKHSNALRQWSRRSKSEKELYDHLVVTFPDLEILPNDKTMLDGLEVDVAIPSLSLAIEWNGAVHFKPMFGESHLAKTQERDRKKLAIASRQDINLIVIADPNFNREVLEQAKVDTVSIISGLLLDRNADASGGKLSTRSPLPEEPSG